MGIDVGRERDRHALSGGLEKFGADFRHPFGDADDDAMRRDDERIG